MMKVTCVLVVSLLLAFSAFANPDVSVGSVDPLPPPTWGLDDITWSSAGNAMTPFGRAASGIIGEYCYFFGEQNSNLGQAYHIPSGTWSTATAPLMGNCNWCGVVANDQLYIIGRYDGGYGTEVQRFTPTAGGPTGTWDLMAPYPLSYCGVGAAWDGADHIYACGGDATAPSAYKYSISGNTWTAIANPPGPQRYNGGAFAGGKFYSIGGYNWATTNYAYDPGTDTWSTAADVPEPLYFATFSVTEGEGYVISAAGGGGYGSWPATTAAMYYDPATDTWTVDTPIPWSARGLNSTIYMGGNEVMVAGGYDGVFYTDGYRGIDWFSATTPVLLSAFNANVVEDGVLLTWSTASEIDCYEWTVQRNGVDVATLPGHGTTIEPQSYSYLDEVGAGNYTYRLKETDIGGAVTYFDEITVTVGAVVVTEYSLSNNYPNPFNPSTNIAFALPEAGIVNLSVYSLNGSLITTLADGQRDAGVYEVTFDATGLTSGIYFCKLTAGDYSSMQKMVLLR
jgi:hypothetical protein